MLTPVGTAMLFRAFPPEHRARASRILVVPTAAAPALGPIIGGLLVDQLSWRWVFYINLPIAVAAFAFGAIFLVEHREHRPGRFDLAGFVLAGSGLALILYALGEGPTHGWTSPEVLIPGLIGLTAFALLVRVELTRREPMLRLRLLVTNRLFRTSNLVCTFAFGSFLGLLVMMPLFLQELRGVSALQSGLTTFPEAVGVLAASQVVGRLYPVVGPRRLMIGGLSTVATAMVLLSFVGVDTSLWVIRGVMFLGGAGMAFVFVPLQVSTFATISPSDTGQASAIYNAQRQTSAALGVAVLSTVLFSRADGPIEAANPHAADAFRIVFLVDAAIALLGVAAATRIRDADAAGTMRVRPRGAPAEEPAVATH